MLCSMYVVWGQNRNFVAWISPFNCNEGEKAREGAATSGRM